MLDGGPSVPVGAAAVPPGVGAAPHAAPGSAGAKQVSGSIHSLRYHTEEIQDTDALDLTDFNFWQKWRKA